MPNALLQYEPRAEMQHKPFSPPKSPMYDAITTWGRGVKQRTLHPLESLAQASQDMIDADPLDTALNWSNPVAAGLAGMFAGVGAKTADVVKLGLAEKLKKAGVPDREIHAQTGWTFGFADGKPRFEIPDDAARLKEAAIPGGKWQVGQALGHDPLYGYGDSAYPALRNTPLTYDKGAGGQFIGEGNQGMRVGVDNPKSTTLHELQHAIQQREGFARGGSPEMFKSSPESLQGLHSYDDMAHAEQIINMAKQYGKTVDEFMQNPPRWVTDKQVAIAKNFENRPVKDLQYAKNYIIEKTDPIEAYQRLAGEVEARLTQQRMNMTSEQRLHSYPIDQMDVPIEQQIVRYGDGQAMSVPKTKYSDLYDAIVKAGNDELSIKKNSNNLWVPDDIGEYADNEISKYVYPKNTGKKYPDPLPEYTDKYGDLGGAKYEELYSDIYGKLKQEWVDANYPNFSEVTDLYKASPNQQGSAFEAGLKQIGVKYRPEYSSSSQSNYFYVDNPITGKTDKIRFATHRKQAYDADDADINVNPEGGVDSHTWDDAQSYLESLLEFGYPPPVIKP